MQVKTVIFPSEDGLNVIVWGKWTTGSMRIRNFVDREEMIAALQGIGLISAEDAKDLENFAFVDSCPLFSSDIDEEVLSSHRFRPA